MKKQKTILVVEDDEDFRNILCNVLMMKKYTILQAKNGKEGVDTALAKHPDMILLDMQMPVMDGMTAFKEIRQDKAWGADIPVIILTNLSATDEKTVEGMVNFKPAYYLIKSNFKAVDIVKKAEEILGV